MEALIIQVDCRPYTRDGPPQLGITVEAPYSQQRTQAQRKKQLASTKESYQNHDYQNLDNCNFNLTNSNGGSTKLTNISKNSKSGQSSLRNITKQHIANVFSGSQSNHGGLQITKIQPDSIIDHNGQFKVGDIIVECNGVNLQRPFTEAQGTLKQFVIEQTSHAPLVMKVLRKAASSSSIPSTTGSQITVIERDSNYSKDSLQSSPAISGMRQGVMTQQAGPSDRLIPARSTSSPTRTSSRHLADNLNTKKMGVKHTIRLKKSPGGGFGIKIAERDNMHGRKSRPIYITAILTSGSAHRDGRLQEGDMLLEVNGYDLHGKSQPEVTRMLKAMSPDQEVEFVISRQEVATKGDGKSRVDCAKSSAENDCDKSLIDLDVPEHDDSVFEFSNQQFEKKIDSLLNIPIRDGPGVYVYDVPLNDTKSAGLGLYLKYLKRADEGKDLGIWIEKVITGGAAWKDGRLQPDDQILAINGLDLINLSNTEAHRTLNAAVCRGIGPEATPNTIRLQIHRRDPMSVASILRGTTNNRIECSDIMINTRDRPLSIFDKNFDNSCESYQTALENTTQNRTNDFKDSSDSSNPNSQNDSAMSPQTQASNSIRLTNSYNGRSEHDSSDKTNETTSSAISQITNSTSNVPITNTYPSSKLYDEHCDNQLATQPKSIHTDINSEPQNNDCTSSSQSLDDESTDATGEGCFQREGPHRQSMSVKSNAQLNAKNTETYRRNKRLREEREQQRQLEEQMARQHLDDERRRAYGNTSATTHKSPISYTTDEFKSIYGLKKGPDRLPYDNDLADSYHREVPVDVHLPVESRIDAEPLTVRPTNKQVYDNNLNSTYGLGSEMGFVNQGYSAQPTICCPRCGLNCPCLCNNNNQAHPQSQLYGQRQDFPIKRSNSLESIQQHPVRDGLVVPRAGTVRVARNRKVNESFRAAVDRSYEGSVHESSSRQDQSDLSDYRHISVGTKMSGSIANSTTSTSNEERYLISNQSASINNNSSNTSATHKKSSLLTKFLKFGSIKRRKKNRNPEEPVKPVEVRSSASKSSRDSERSQSSKNSHARTHSSQSHPNLTSHHSENRSKKSDMIPNGHHMNNQHMNQTVLGGASNIVGAQYHNGLEVRPHPPHASMHMCQQPQYQLMSNHNNSQYNKTPIHPNNMPMTMISKQALNMTMVTRPQVNNQAHAHHPQYSHQTMQSMSQHHHLQQQHVPVAGATSTLMNQLGHDHSLYSSTRNEMILNPLLNNTRPTNGDYQHQPQQWHSSHFQAPNGLWVTNSSATENPIHQVGNLYGTVPQHSNGPSHLSTMTLQRPVNIHQHQTSPPQTSSNGCVPFMQQLNGTTNGVLNNSGHLYHNNHMGQSHHQVPFNTMHPPAPPPPVHNHHQQPQQIYYYDF